MGVLWHGAIDLWQRASVLTSFSLGRGVCGGAYDPAQIAKFGSCAQSPAAATFRTMGMTEIVGEGCCVWGLQKMLHALRQPLLVFRCLCRRKAWACPGWLLGVPYLGSGRYAPRAQTALVFCCGRLYHCTHGLVRDGGTGATFPMSAAGCGWRVMHEQTCSIRMDSPRFCSGRRRFRSRGFVGGGGAGTPFHHARLGL